MHRMDRMGTIAPASVWTELPADLAVFARIDACRIERANGKPCVEKP
jgi:hypothetical protein